MGDFGSTTFGYTIAYVIPGLTAAVATFRRYLIRSQRFLGDG